MNVTDTSANPTLPLPDFTRKSHVYTIEEIAPRNDESTQRNARSLLETKATAGGLSGSLGALVPLGSKTTGRSKGHSTNETVLNAVPISRTRSQPIISPAFLAQQLSQEVLLEDGTPRPDALRRGLLAYRDAMKLRYAETATDGTQSTFV